MLSDTFRPNTIETPIFTSPEDCRNTPLLRHEFGHVLQARRYGYLWFYLFTGPKSLVSACLEQAGRRYQHKNARVEKEANLLSYTYFKSPDDWDHQSFPRIHSANPY